MTKTLTLGEWLDKWYALYVEPYLKQSTLVSYECYIRKHIKPFLGSIPLTDIDGMLLQNFFNEKYKSGRLDNRGGLSEKTLYNLRMMLHAVFRKALQNDLVQKNYVEHVLLPKVVHKEMRVLTLDEQNRIQSVLSTERDEYSFGILLCLSTGIRIGELCGLKWKDFDLERKPLKIRRTVQRLKNVDPDKKSKTSIVIGTPKSQASIRDIPFTDAIVTEIEIHKKLLSENFSSCIVSEEQFVITRQLNHPIEPRTMQDAFKITLKYANVSDANFHSMRHTFATRALEAGIDFKVLSQLLGHADIATTMNRYAHVLDDKKRTAMETILSQFLF